ncbi:hypothetical protein IE53DRAFT_163367 [Violaceomyces palustris]|uniref:Uncharacterized protein n=1 Tax=Violaceomyces palustris TaxID=1673888 RepID=A0ACD0NTD8_9BASI|nr:hypothetical protein IE53DRAFT_163367 [Violaceomyces palustris]
MTTRLAFPKSLSRRVVMETRSALFLTFCAVVLDFFSLSLFQSHLGIPLSTFSIPTPFPPGRGSQKGVLEEDKGS